MAIVKIVIGCSSENAMGMAAVGGAVEILLLIVIQLWGGMGGGVG